MVKIVILPKVLQETFFAPRGKHVNPSPIAHVQGGVEVTVVWGNLRVARGIERSCWASTKFKTDSK